MSGKNVKERKKRTGLPSDDSLREIHEVGMVGWNSITEWLLFIPVASMSPSPLRPLALQLQTTRI
jgi:hypothetical protein